MAALDTCRRSTSLPNRKAMSVPHCESIVGSISAGRWLTIMAPTPYFLPSLTILRTASAAAGAKSVFGPHELPQAQRGAGVRVRPRETTRPEDGVVQDAQKGTHNLIDDRDWNP